MELPVFDFSPVPQNSACTGRVAHNTLAFGFFLTILEKSVGFLPRPSHVLLEDSSTLGNAMDSRDGNRDLQKCNSFAESHILSHMDTNLLEWLTSYQKEEHSLLLHSRMTAPSTVNCQDIGCSLRSDVHLNRQYQPERIYRNNGNIVSVGWRIETASSGTSLLSWANDNTSRGDSIGPFPVAAVGACPCFMDKSQEHCLVIHRYNFCTCER